MFKNKYILEGYHPYESSYLRIFESGSVGPRKYFKEIEIIIQVVNEHFEEKSNYMFNINETDGCNIDIADAVNIYVVYDENENNAEYDSDSAVYDKKMNRMESIDIMIYLNPLDTEFNESKLREDLIHELNHAYEDKCMRCLVIPDDEHKEEKENRKTSLMDSYDLCQVDIQKILQFYSSDVTAQVLYRFFIKTETNAFVSQLYGDLASLNKKKKLQPENYYKDLKQTETYKIYAQLKKYYEDNIHYNEVNWAKVMRFFPNVISKRMYIHKNNRYEFDKRFANWFRRTLKYKLKIVWIKLCKVAAQFYTDQHNGNFDVNYNDIVNKAKQVAVKMYEAVEINKVDYYTVNCIYPNNVVYFTIVEFHPIVLKV